jgi:predicted DCC family thiol-disulfide oxidoreductase YuxK
MCERVTPPLDLQDHPLVLFDGVCGLCNRAVDFLLAHDHRATLRFAPLQSPIGQQWADGDARISSVVLVENGRAFYRSTAALRTLKHLGFPWALAYGLIIIPPFLRNWVYEIVARHRYKWFGKRAACRMPTAEERGRFIA